MLTIQINLKRHTREPNCSGQPDFDSGVDADIPGIAINSDRDLLVSYAELRGSALKKSISAFSNSQVTFVVSHFFRS